MTKDGISTTLRAMNAERRTLAPGTARETRIAENGFSPSLELRGHLVPTTPCRAAADLANVVEAERQQHRLLQPLIDFHLPFCFRVRQRGPRPCRADQAHDPRRRGLALVEVEIPSRASKAVLTVVSRAARDMGCFLERRAFSGCFFGNGAGESRRLAAGAAFSTVVPANAGTPNHRAMLLRRLERQRARRHGLWLWVPARASPWRDDSGELQQLCKYPVRSSVTWSTWPASRLPSPSPRAPLPACRRAPPAPWSCRAGAALRDCARDPRTSPTAPDRRREGSGSVIVCGAGFGSNSAAMMSNTPSKCPDSPSRARRHRPWSTEPLVRISLRPGSFSIAAPIAGFGLQRRVVDPVHIGEEIVGADAMLGHHAAHRGAVAAVVVLLDAGASSGDTFRKVRTRTRDPRIDLLPQIDVMRIRACLSRSNTQVST